MAIFITLFVSAFLLFQVQLVVGKSLLPLFGGTPMVWTRCLLFFQSLLLAGYGYVHWLSGFRSTLRARRLHRIVFVLAGVTLVMGVLVNGVPLLPGSSGSKFQRSLVATGKALCPALDRGGAPLLRPVDDQSAIAALASGPPSS